MVAAKCCRQGTLALSTRLFTLFAGRILSHAEKAAEVLVKTNTSAQTLDKPMGFAGCAIAARASAHGCAAATRNMGDFKRAGMSVIGPWTVRDKRARNAPTRHSGCGNTAAKD